MKKLMQFISITGGPDLRTLLNAFGGGGGQGSLEQNALSGLINQFQNSGGAGSNNNPVNSGGGSNYPPPPAQVPNVPSPQSPNVHGDSGSNDNSGFLSLLGNLAKSQLATQLLQRAAAGDDDGGASSRRVGGVFSQNPSSRGSGYPTQNYPVQQQPLNAEVQRQYSANNNQPTGLSASTDKPLPYGWNV